MTCCRLQQTGGEAGVTATPATTHTGSSARRSTGAPVLRRWGDDVDAKHLLSTSTHDCPFRPEKLTSVWGIGSPRTRVNNDGGQNRPGGVTWTTS